LSTNKQRPYSKDNIAVGKPARQLGSIDATQGAALGNDGNTSTCSVTSILSDVSGIDIYPYWSIRFDNYVVVSHIELTLSSIVSERGKLKI